MEHSVDMNMCFLINSKLFWFLFDLQDINNYCYYSFVLEVSMKLDNYILLLHYYTSVQGDMAHTFNHLNKKHLEQCIEHMNYLLQ